MVLPAEGRGTACQRPGAGYETQVSGQAVPRPLAGIHQVLHSGISGILILVHHARGQVPCSLSRAALLDHMGFQYTF